MKIIVCVDNKGGVMFNRRRQSQDRVLREHILEMTSGHALWMNSYSAKMFGDHSGIIVTEDFLDRASEDDFCFMEPGRSTQLRKLSFSDGIGPTRRMCISISLPSPNTN